MTENPRRDINAYTEALAKLLPAGPAWPRESESILMQFIKGQAGLFADPFDVRAHQLLDVEVRPDLTDEMLLDWERNVGLPEECYADVVLTADQRRERLVEKLTSLRGQSRQYFLDLVESLGQTAPAIDEFMPYECGWSELGFDELGSPLQRFRWTLTLDPTDYDWRECGDDECGFDEQAMPQRDILVECLVDKRKPAHTRVRFFYPDIPQPPAAGLTFTTTAPIIS